jgi:Zn-dependent M28 family amino/carboxypeptidase
LSLEPEVNSALSIQHCYNAGIMRKALQFLVCAALLLISAVPAGAQTATVDGAQLLKDLETLSADAMEGRLPGTPGGAKARAYILQRYKEAGIQPIGDSYERPFTFRGRGAASDSSGVNIIGVVRGRRAPEHFIVLTAHFDHLGVRNGQIFNGADDNASGVAALLAIAAKAAADKPEHSLVFAALDAEESGLNGARAFMKDPPVARDAIVMNVNMDMVARDASNVLFASGTFQYPFLKTYLKDVARPPVTLRLGHDGTNPKEDDWTRDSDHFPFHEAGIPFIYFGVEDEAQHHKATDDAETVTKEFFIGAANTILAAVRTFDANLDAIMARSRAGR